MSKFVVFLCITGFVYTCSISKYVVIIHAGSQTCILGISTVWCSRFSIHPATKDLIVRWYKNALIDHKTIDNPGMIFEGHVYTTPLQILTSEAGEDVQINACKLLEVIVIQCQGRIDAVSGYLQSSAYTYISAWKVYMFSSQRGNPGSF